MASARADTPAQVAGIVIPRTAMSVRAEEFVRAHEPDFLFNHSVRTYVFGALRLQQKGVSFDPETAYVAALFHDAGLVPSMASPSGSFEIDGADQAEKFVLANGGSPEQARTVWNAIVFHDMPPPYQRHQSPEARLLGNGAGADVDGANPQVYSAGSVAQLLTAFPRLQFKKRFTALAIDHCKRKPTSQIGWLDQLCRTQVPNIDRGSVEEEIASAPFAE
ncbi:HD domain-containing protein [Sphingomonas sp.]|uniref:HD domain-containing protein n=1 Tax=Sphingomonas sp. TaxID=28214 RepID=UPI00389E2CD7